MTAADGVQGFEHPPAEPGDQLLRFLQPVTQGEVDEWTGATGLVVFVHGAETGRRVAAIVAQHGKAHLLLLYRGDLHIEQGRVEVHGAIQIPCRNVGPDQGVVHLRILQHVPADAVGGSLRVGVGDEGRQR